MADVWKRIQQLEGQTLYTAARHTALRIDYVSDAQVFFTPESTGKPRFCARTTFEHLAGLGLQPHELTRSRISEEEIRGDRFNTSYVHAILCAIGMAV